MTTLALAVLLCIILAETGLILYLIARRPGTKTEEVFDKEEFNREKLAAIWAFSSIVSHELKNPLASLKNISYFFSKMPVLENPQAKRMMDILGTEIEKMNDMILNLLDLSRVKRYEKAPCDIGVLAEEAFRATPLPDTITVTKNIESITLTFDAKRFTQIITALITNARDAMPDGGHIDFSLKRNGTSAAIVFHDTGIGMDSATCARAFDPLFTTKTKTLGLGLTIAREIARNHDGHMELTSEKGAGTTVTLTFPIPAAPAKP